MKYNLMGFFGGLMAGLTLFILSPSPLKNASKGEDDSFTLGLYMGVPTGLASLIWIIAYLATGGA